MIHYFSEYFNCFQQFPKEIRISYVLSMDLNPNLGFQNFLWDEKDRVKTFKLSVKICIPEILM